MTITSPYPDSIDFGVDPEPYAASGNPWIRDLPVRWTARLPVGLAESEQTLADLRAELAGIDATVPAGDDAKTFDLRTRRAILPALIDAAEITLVGLRIDHAEAGIALTLPVARHLLAVQEQKQRARAAAELEEAQINFAVTSVTTARRRFEEHRDAATKRHAELLMPGTVTR